MATPVPVAQQTATEQYLLAQIASLKEQIGTAEANIQTNLQEAKARDQALNNDMNAEWLILCGALGFFMQAGFAMLECGVVSKNNVINILFKNLVDNCVAGCNWWLFAYAFAYGETAGGFIGSTNFAISNMWDGAKNGTAQTEGWENFFFQWAFVATATTIVSGCVCERVRIQAYLVSSFAVSAWIYPVVVHWVWGEGFMSSHRADGRYFFTMDGRSNGLLDFAGSGVVHVVGGVCGLVGAIAVGPRLGRFGPKGEVLDMPEHNISTMALGIFILWFGWYGFNCGSTLGIIGSGGIAAKVAVNTTIAASGGCLVGILFAYKLERTFNVCVAMNGILAGLVSITASCAFVNPWMAFIIGTVGSSIHYAARRMLHKLQIDDPLDAVPIHFFGGSWGLLCSGIFCTDEAVRFAGYPTNNDACASGRQFGTQFIGFLIITSWSALFAFIYWQIAKVLVGLRVSAEVEEMGMDAIEHGNTAYNVRLPTRGFALEFGGGEGMAYDDNGVVDATQKTNSFDPYMPKNLQAGDVISDRSGHSANTHTLSVGTAGGGGSNFVRITGEGSGQGGIPLQHGIILTPGRSSSRQQHVPVLPPLQVVGAQPTFPASPMVAQRTGQEQHALAL